jgi:hypothetical protein
LKSSYPKTDKRQIQICVTGPGGCLIFYMMKTEKDFKVVLEKGFGLLQSDSEPDFFSIR